MGHVSLAEVITASMYCMRTNATETVPQGRAGDSSCKRQSPHHIRGHVSIGQPNATCPLVHQLTCHGLGMYTQWRELAEVVETRVTQGSPPGVLLLFLRSAGYLKEARYQIRSWENCRWIGIVEEVSAGRDSRIVWLFEFGREFKVSESHVPN